ncbi:glutamate decarboxylase [Rhodotorula diobovata]|uniref:Glutamate decarboxylase n=1 Tax=Rhodotorula diobovata TaxID=5288 RepID=A0A5C5G697_9BASI|nr:glutamate decarboxylase [Rhodotorula diobovata]
MLSRHVNSQKVLEQAREHSARHRHGKPTVHEMLDREAPGTISRHPASKDYGTEPIPKYAIPSHGVPAAEAYELVNNELSLDGNPLLNLASFVHTSMDSYADKLMMENKAKNLIDQDEYPATQLLHTRLISMLAKLWHADDVKENATGTATTGSSEAIQLAGLAMKKAWQARRKAQGKSIHEPGPNIIMGANAQVALEKAARYFDIEARYVPVDASTRYCMDPKRAIEFVDENTIGVFVILGSTYTGAYESVQEMSDLLDEYERKTGISVPIHVDGASGAMFAPFATPSLIWDFRIPRVVSINTSLHKWGKAYVGVGAVLWRSKEHLPKELVFELTYLGSVEYSFSLNFSRPAAPVIAAYWNLLHLGHDGYRRISLHDAKNARLFARAVERSKYYKVVSEIHHLKSDQDQSLVDKAKQATGLSDDIDSYIPGLPVVAFMFSDEFRNEYPRIKQRNVQLQMRQKSWIIPNYSLPANAEGEEVLRVVFRETFHEDMVERLFHDLVEVTENMMEEHKADVAHPGSGSGHHPGPNDRAGSKSGSIAEKLASSHGEGTRPVRPCLAFALLCSTVR